MKRLVCLAVFGALPKKDQPHKAYEAGAGPNGGLIKTSHDRRRQSGDIDKRQQSGTCKAGQSRVSRLNGAPDHQ
jgi:hypothetical protein